MIEEAEMPTIKRSNELLIQVIAASLHDVDIKICTGYSKTYRKLLNSTVSNITKSIFKKLLLHKLS